MLSKRGERISHEDFSSQTGFGWELPNYTSNGPESDNDTSPSQFSGARTDWFQGVATFVMLIILGTLDGITSILNTFGSGMEFLVRWNVRAFAGFFHTSASSLALSLSPAVSLCLLRRHPPSFTNHHSLF